MERMAGITDKVLPHLEKMEPAEILDSARNLERFDYVARRNYGSDEQSAVRSAVNFNVLVDAFRCALKTSPLFIWQMAARLSGYPAWIRTMNNASKGRCVTVTPRGIAGARQN